MSNSRAVSGHECTHHQMDPMMSNHKMTHFIKCISWLIESSGHYFVASLVPSQIRWKQKQRNDNVVPLFCTMLFTFSTLSIPRYIHIFINCFAAIVLCNVFWLNHTTYMYIQCIYYDSAFNLAIDIIGQKKKRSNELNFLDDSYWQLL